MLKNCTPLVEDEAKFLLYGLLVKNSNPSFDLFVKHIENVLKTKNFDKTYSLSELYDVYNSVVPNVKVVKNDASSQAFDQGSITDVSVLGRLTPTLRIVSKESYDENPVANEEFFSKYAIPNSEDLQTVKNKIREDALNIVFGKDVTEETLSEKLNTLKDKYGDTPIDQYLKKYFDVLLKMYVPFIKVQKTNTGTVYTFKQSEFDGRIGDRDEKIFTGIPEIFKFLVETTRLNDNTDGKYPIYIKHGPQFVRIIRQLIIQYSRIVNVTDGESLLEFLKTVAEDEDGRYKDNSVFGQLFIKKIYEKYFVDERFNHNQNLKNLILQNLVSFSQLNYVHLTIDDGNKILLNRQDGSYAKSFNSISVKQASNTVTLNGDVYTIEVIADDGSTIRSDGKFEDLKKSENIAKAAALFGDLLSIPYNSGVEALLIMMDKKDAFFNALKIALEHQTATNDRKDEINNKITTFAVANKDLIDYIFNSGSPATLQNISGNSYAALGLVNPLSLLFNRFGQIRRNAESIFSSNFFISENNDNQIAFYIKDGVETETSVQPNSQQNDVETFTFDFNVWLESRNDNNGKTLFNFATFSDKNRNSMLAVNLGKQSIETLIEKLFEAEKSYYDILQKNIIEDFELILRTIGDPRHTQLEDKTDVNDPIVKEIIESVSNEKIRQAQKILKDQGIYINFYEFIHYTRAGSGPYGNTHLMRELKSTRNLEEFTTLLKQHEETYFKNIKAIGFVGSTDLLRQYFYEWNLIARSALPLMQGRVFQYKDKNFDPSGQWIAMTKRNVNMQSTYYMILKGLPNTTPTKEKWIIVSDPKMKLYNITGQEKEVDRDDGAIYVLPLTAKLQQNGLGGLYGQQMGINAKPIYHSIDERIGAMTFVKSAQFQMTNERIRSSSYDSGFENQFSYLKGVKALLNFPISQQQLQLIDFDSLGDVYYYDRDTKSVVELTKDTFKEQLSQINTVYDLWKLLGGEYSLEISDHAETVDGQALTHERNKFIFSEKSWDQLYEIYLQTQFDFASGINNVSTTKTGYANVNTATQINNEDVVYVELELVGGPQLNKTHESESEDEAELTAPTQVLSSAIFNGATAEQASKLYDIMSKLATVSLNEVLGKVSLQNIIQRYFETGTIKEADKKELISSILEKNVAEDASVLESFKRYIQTNGTIPIGAADVKNFVQNLVAAYFTNNAIRQKFTGGQQIVSPNSWIIYDLPKGSMYNGKLLEEDVPVLEIEYSNWLSQNPGQTLKPRKLRPQMILVKIKDEWTDLFSGDSKHIGTRNDELTGELHKAFLGQKSKDQTVRQQAEIVYNNLRRLQKLRLNLLEDNKEFYDLNDVPTELLSEDQLMSYLKLVERNVEIKSQPGEVIAPQLYKDKFRIKPGQKISEINIDHFVKVATDLANKGKIKEKDIESHAEKMFSSFKLTLETVIARIPSQSFQSWNSAKIIGYLNNEANTFTSSSHSLWFKGEDMDIDVGNVMAFSTDSTGVINGWNPNFDVNDPKTWKEINTSSKEGLLNAAVYLLQSISKNPKNYIYNESPISMDDVEELKENAEGSMITLIAEDPVSTAVQKVTNMTGKSGIGTGATNIKAESAIQLAFAKLTKGFQGFSVEKLMKPFELANKKYFFKAGVEIDKTIEDQLEGAATVYFLSGNTDKEVREKIRKELLESIEESKRNSKTVDDLLSQILSAATDNAKELILSKINANAETIAYYGAAISAGVPLKEIGRIMMSPEAKLIVNLTQGNIFNQQARMSMDKAIEYIKSGKYKNNSNSSDDTDYDTFDPSDIYDSFDESGDNTTVKRDYTAEYVKSYMEINNIANLKTDRIEEFESLYRKGKEFSVLARLLGINQSVKKTALDIFKFEYNFESYVKDKIPAFNLRQFLSDITVDENNNTTLGDYAKRMITEYDGKMELYNILLVLAANPMYVKFLKTQVLSDDLMKSNKSKSAKRIVQQMLAAGTIKSYNIQKVWESVERALSDYVLHLFLSQKQYQNFTINYKNEDNVFNLSTLEGIERFKEFVFITTRSLKSALNTNYERIYETNMFIERLTQDKTKSGKKYLKINSDNNSTQIETASFFRELPPDIKKMYQMYALIQSKRKKGSNDLTFYVDNTAAMITEHLEYEDKFNEDFTLEALLPGIVSTAISKKVTSKNKVEKPNIIYRIWDKANQEQKYYIKKEERVVEIKADENIGYTLVHPHIKSSVDTDSKPKSNDIALLHEYFNIFSNFGPKIEMKTGEELENVIKGGASKRAFVYNGVIYVNTDKAGAGDLVEEFGHLYYYVLKAENPSLLLEIEAKIKNSPYMDEIKRNPFYSKLSEQDQIEEAIQLFLNTTVSKNIDSFKNFRSMNKSLIFKALDFINKMLTKLLGNYSNKTLEDLMKEYVGSVFNEKYYNVSYQENVAEKLAKKLNVKINKVC